MKLGGVSVVVTAHMRMVVSVVVCGCVWLSHTRGKCSTDSATAPGLTGLVVCAIVCVAVCVWWCERDDYRCGCVV